MTTAEVIHLGQELIAKVGMFEDDSEESRTQLSRDLDEFEARLWDDSSKHGNRVRSFIEDIRWDIADWREVKIDGIESDEQVRTYLETERQIEVYNNLIDVALYKKIFHELNSETCDQECVHKYIQELKNHFEVEFKKLSSKIIAKNMLIFSLFERNLPLPALMRLSKFLRVWKDFEKDFEITDSLQQKYREFTASVYHECAHCYKNDSYNYKFLRIHRDKNKDSIRISFYVEDASYENLRSGNHKFEYREILRKLKP